MSTRSKVALTLSLCAFSGILSYVFWDQEYQRTRMREGVIKDMEKQIKRQKILQEREEKVGSSETSSTVEGKS